MALKPTPPAPASAQNMGEPAPRYESRAKVTGQPLYAADLGPGEPAYAVFATSAIAKGRVSAIDETDARRVAGVIEVFTWRNAPKWKPSKHLYVGGRVTDTRAPLASPEIAHDGEPVALVVADSFEAACEAVDRLKVSYLAAPASASFDSEGVETQTVSAINPQHRDKSVGDFAAGWAQSAVKVDARYSTPTQHHNAIELYSVTAEWRGDDLVVYEPTQFLYSSKNLLAEALDIPAERVRVLCPCIGGGFGGKGMSQRSALIAAVARALGRPVKLVMPRDQGFTGATYRAETRHHVRLGADRSGKLTALAHEGWELCSRYDSFSVNGTDSTTEMYACPDVWSRVSVVRADRNSPGFMRSPPEMPYMFALESAMDELAASLGMDPVELRRRNDTMTSPISGVPYTSRSAMPCFDAAAASFGWAQRDPRPMSMRDGDWQVGFGCAMAVYPSGAMAATARVRLTSDGSALVQTATHEIGQGAYSALQQIAAERLRVPLDRVRVELGDSNLPPGSMTGGSMTTASCGSAVAAACDQVTARFGGDMPSPDQLKTRFEQIGVSSIEEYAEWAPPGAASSVANLYRGQLGGGGGGSEKPLMYAFGAEFVEVRVHARTREIRVPRITGAFAAGRIINPRTTRSQYLGGMIWGLGSALLEETHLDPKRARYTNDNLADYLIAVNADVPQVDIILVPEVDAEVNPLGAKGVGELANVGTPAAVANAVYHATGKRIRDLPITLDKLL